MPSYLEIGHLKRFDDVGVAHTMHGCVCDVKLGLSISLGVEDPCLQQTEVRIHHLIQLQVIKSVWGEIYLPTDPGLQALQDTLLDLFISWGDYL